MAWACAAAAALGRKAVFGRRKPRLGVAAVLRVWRVAGNVAERAAAARRLSVAVGRDEAARAVEMAASALT